MILISCLSYHTVLVKSTQLNFLTPMIYFKTGKPMLSLDATLAKKLGIKKNDDIEQYRDQIPSVTFADIFDQLMDDIPFSSNKHFAIYNNILIDIRNAKVKELEYVEIEKTDLETLRTIFEHALVGKSEINRSIGFMFEVIDQCIADIINENNPPKIKN